MITQPPLNTKDTAGVVGQPVYKNGVENIISTMSASTTNPGTDLNGSYNQTNLSAKFKNPSVKQDVPSKGNSQYM